MYSFVLNRLKNKVAAAICRWVQWIDRYWHWFGATNLTSAAQIQEKLADLEAKMKAMAEA